MHDYHSLVPSHEKRIVVGSWINLNLTLILTAEQKISELFSITRITLNKKWKSLAFNNIQ